MILLQLNELNFDIVKTYINKRVIKLPNIESYLATHTEISTSVNEAYHELEPWIQWVSFYTCKPYSAHKVFRLGAIAERKDLSFFPNELAEQGKSVGVLGSMNLRMGTGNYKYFISDPWNANNTDNSFFSKIFWNAINQAINDNSSKKLTLPTLITLLYCVIFLIPAGSKKRLLSLLIKSRKKRWFRALAFELLLVEIFIYLNTRHRPEHSFCFLNVAAHIQHHYFLNSKVVKTEMKNSDSYVAAGADPLADALVEYDFLLGRTRQHAMKMQQEISIVTGISQIPYDRYKAYYRPQNHEKFLKKLNISFLKVEPRMTRDFMITCGTDIEAETCAKALTDFKLQSTNSDLFGDITIRGKYVDVSLKIDEEIDVDCIVFDPSGIEYNIGSDVTLVALKNGMHCPKGFAYLPDQIGATELSLEDLGKHYFALMSK